MLADLPPDTQAELMRRLAARLESTSLGGGALVPALADVIQDALERAEHAHLAACPSCRGAYETFTRLHPGA